jgi:hypothetical protein
MTARADNPAFMDRRTAFLASLQRLEQWLAAEQVPYAVFGSVAATAWIDQGASLDFDRLGARHRAERIPDIDLLVPRASLHQVKGYARAARRGDAPVSIDTFWSECWIDFRPDSPLSYLTHRQVRITVPTELFAPSTASLLGQQVAVLDPRTLLRMYDIVGVTRRKDAPRIAALTGALTSGTLTSRFTGQDCQVFDAFLLARRRRYPLFFAAKRGWVRLTDALPPRASQFLTHHVQLRADGLYRMLASRQAHRSRR